MNTNSPQFAAIVQDIVGVDAKIQLCSPLVPPGDALGALEEACGNPWIDQILVG
jgi:hypothetical protein